jgi:hypothetical protein
MSEYVEALITIPFSEQLVAQLTARKRPAERGLCW